MKIKSTLVCMLALHMYCYSQNITGSQNFVVEKTFLREYKMGVNIDNKPVDSINVNSQYFDGFGRLLQTVQWQGSPNKRDIVKHFEYDQFGLERKKFLLYTEQYSNTGEYQSDAKVSQLNFYSVGGGWDDNVVKTLYPYSETIFDNSPLNKVVEQGLEGNDWQPKNLSIAGSGHTKKVKENVNTNNEIYNWNSVPGLNIIGKGSAYLSGRVKKSIFFDENWLTGKAGSIENFTDKRGRKVLERIWESENSSSSTYYVYDNLDNILYVLPPSVSETGTQGQSFYYINNPLVDEHIYVYRYDLRNRIKEKKMPAKGWEYYIYNLNDQPILYQDAKLREENKWLYTKYDVFGRITEKGIHTGVYENQQSCQTIANNVNNASGKYWEERNMTLNYSNQSFPLLNNIPLVIYYYDDYTFENAGISSLQPLNVNYSNLTDGLLTGTKVFKDDGTLPLLTINYYDDKARLIQSASQNHLNTNNSGTDYVTNTYNFVGDLLTSKREHKSTASGAVTTVLNSNTYDHVGRLKDIKHKINTQSEVILVRNEYNEIGQLKIKKQHSENGGTNFINSTTFSYNEQGWTTKATSSHFTYQLNYNTGLTPQYNGNISQQLWGHGTINTPNVYSYSYDKLNRLLSGTSTGTVMSEELTYDEMGNIKTLKRDNGAVTTYNYTVNSVSSNRLQGVTGGLSGIYTYDVNGNATKDRTGMTFRYNHLNLPDSIWSSTIKVGYLYDANGTKLRKYKNNAIHRDYVGGIEYAGGTIEMIHTNEGYLQRSGTNYIYHYNLTDHLGNVRAVLYKNTVTGAIETVQQTDYYPFGKQKTLKAGINKYLYNGKEVQEELGNQQDYGARFYDPEIGRWNVVDPMADSYHSNSPYNYALNDPIGKLDPNGMWVEDANGYSTNNPDEIAEYMRQLNGNDQEDPDKKKKGNLLINGPGKIISKNGVSQVQQGDPSTDYFMDNLMELGIGFSPFGIASDIRNAFVGEDMAGTKLSWGWRLGGLIPLFSEFKNSKNILKAATEVFGKQVAEIAPRLGRDGEAVEIIFKDGSKIDINTARVKEWIPNTHPKAPSGTLQKVKFENSLPGSKGFKREATQAEIDYLKNLLKK